MLTVKVSGKNPLTKEELQNTTNEIHEFRKKNKDIFTEKEATLYSELENGFRKLLSEMKFEGGTDDTN